jgi:hypothetical protein
MNARFRANKKRAAISASARTKAGTIFVRPKVYDRTYDRTPERTTERTTARPQRPPERPKAYDRATAIRTTERTCECADVRPTKNTHRAFFIRKNLLWAGGFSNFWLDIQWRNSHSQQQFVLNVGYPIARLFTKACVWHLNALVCLTSTQVNPD